MGLWHGAAWNFVLWGAYHGCILSLYAILLPKIRLYLKPKTNLGKGILKVLSIIFIFNICAIGSLFFRSQSLEQAGSMLYNLFANFVVTGNAISFFIQYLFFILPLLIVEILQLKHKELTYIFQYPIAIRYSFYYIVLYLMFVYGSQTSRFIYFQF
jgi:D-alanyl-lipoteichoic acid acyltransferase DltB (MBOAT superfamily)